MDRFVQGNAVLSMFCKNYMDLKKDLPIRPSEMGVLNILAETPGPHTSAMLAGLLGVSKPMITAHLSSLREKGYITKQQIPSDKRVYHVCLTQQGHDLVAQGTQALERQLELLESGMGRDGFDALVRLAHQANGILEAKQQEGGDTP